MPTNRTMNDTPTPTPRTDANDLGWQFNEQYGDFDSLSDTPMPWLDFSKMLEEELTAVTEQRDRLAEALKRIANNNVQDTQETDYAYELGRMEGIAKIALQYLEQTEP